MNIRNLKIFYIIGIISLLSACVEVDKTLGLDFVPDNATVDVEQEVFDIPIYTANVDSVLTSSTSIGVVGYLNHPTFGLFTAGSVFRALPYSLGFNYGEAIIDSAALTIYVGSRTQLDGASSVTQPLSLYRLNRDLAYNTAYYSNSLKLGDYNSTKISEDYTYEGGDTIRIRLKDNFVTELLGATKDEMANDTLFLQKFKGFYLEADATASTGTGQVSYFDLTTTYTYITVTYHHAGNDTARYFYYFIEQNTPNFNVYKHNSSSLSNYSSPLPTPAGNAYLESLAGVKPYINFNDVKESITQWLQQKGKDASKLAINKAELVVPIDYGASSYSVAALNLCPAQLTLAYRDTTNAFSFLMDTYFDTFGGTLNRSLQQYSFNLTYYIQGMFTSQALYHTSARDMYLYPLDLSYDSYGSEIKLLGRSYYACGIIKAPEVKLKLTYTILK
jgi:hypothetical protein